MLASGVSRLAAPRAGWTMEERIGRYVLDRPLGEGSAAIVYLAYRDPDRAPVALKVLRAEFAADATFGRRFLREARTAAEVRHPNLVPILDHGEADGRLFLALAYAPGGSVAGAIERETRLTLDRTLAIAADVAAGLDALHASGIVHRDVKPSNVVLTDHGTAALTDFGLAKGRAYTALTALGRLVGSLAYVAPERIGGGEATVASDIYGLGCLVYECLAGSPPFHSATAYQLAFAHMQEEPPSLATLRPDVGPQLEQAIGRALAKQPAHRPASAGAFAALLRAGSESTPGQPAVTSGEGR